MRFLPALAFAALSALQLSPALAATKAAFVESVLPSRPYSDTVSGSASGYVTIGPGSSGVLGVTSLTFTNRGNVNRTVVVFPPLLAGGQTCGSTSVIGGASPRFYVNVPAFQTVHLTYPSPLVLPTFGGQSCIAIGDAYQVETMVNGFIN